MMHEKMMQAINHQIKNELYSSYLYLAMAAHFASTGMDGMAQWMRVQATEELTHAMKFFDFIHEREGRVQLMAIDQPKSEWASPLDAFKAALEHEKFVSAKINDLMRIAHELNDYASVNFLNWFVAEQVEEEASAAKIVSALGMVGERGEGMLMLDRELGSRTFAPPATTNS